ncbi:hypothetical protein KSP39_PZI006003 [Platanthera zijinensis]|uniref:Uncharacterized protein n=1 Tax=Platanthera zijinensis TaxID=2320716 RepID=A0AAP0BSS6_9ASPA
MINVVFYVLVYLILTYVLFYFFFVGSRPPPSCAAHASPSNYPAPSCILEQPLSKPMLPEPLQQAWSSPQAKPYMQPTFWCSPSPLIMLPEPTICLRRPSPSPNSPSSLIFSIMKYCIHASLQAHGRPTPFPLIYYFFLPPFNPCMHHKILSPSKLNSLCMHLPITHGRPPTFIPPSSSLSCSFNPMHSPLFILFLFLHFFLFNTCMHSTISLLPFISHSLPPSHYIFCH